MNMGRIAHLVRRAVGSMSNARPSAEASRRVAAILGEGEFTLWRGMQGRDQRHSIQVLSRFDERCPEATRDERAAALLHDVGKVRANLGWTLRIVATIVGPCGRRFADHHAHEWIGAEMLGETSSRRTIELVSGWCADPVAEALRAADDV